MQILDMKLNHLRERYRTIVNSPPYPIESLDLVNNAICEMIEIINSYYRERGELHKLKGKCFRKIRSYMDELNYKIKKLIENGDIEEVKPQITKRIDTYFNTGK